MMRPIISAVAVAALIAVGTLTLWPRSPAIELSAAAMPPLHELHAIVGVNNLPAQEMEDQSLGFPAASKR